jgi:amino acid efflux transporter
MSSQLSTTRGTALYVGAILGPGLLLLPGLAAAQAGPASILAWVALLLLSGLFATVFAALGRRQPSAGGVMGYVTASIGRRAGRATGWSFLAGVVVGAPVVCLIGASYVVTTTTARALVAAGLLAAVLALAARGLRASASAQLLLVGLLVAVVVVAVGGSARGAELSHWTPFAPHGWMSVGHAAVTLMLSFAGWEAVAPLTTRFADPARQLPRVVAIALAVTTAIYLGLAITTIAVLGPRAATDVPLAELLSRALGSIGPAFAGVAAVVLTLGTTNAYINGAIEMIGDLWPRGGDARGGDAGGGDAGGGDARGGGGRGGGACGGGACGSDNSAARRQSFLGVIGVTGVAVLALYGLRLVSVAGMVELPTALFLAVYLGAMIAAMRMLRGPVRIVAFPAAAAVTVMLLLCGWAIALPGAVILVALLGRPAIRALWHQDSVPRSAPATHGCAAR